MGEKSHLDLYSGKGLAITFMSSWCPCSNDSIPLMNGAYTDNKDKNLAFLMVGIQDSRAKFRQFVEKWQIPFPAGYDEGNRIAREYGVHSPPTTIFIDRNGDVKRVFYGNIAKRKKSSRNGSRRFYSGGKRSPVGWIFVFLLHLASLHFADQPVLHGLYSQYLSRSPAPSC